MAENLPPDLIDLQRAFESADQAVHAHVAAVDAERTGLWSDAENAELERLRGVRMAALNELWAHPEHHAVQAAGRWSALKKAAKE